ncbi:unnamed protein product [Staurois parvus]|uniref:ATP synthase subunit b n=1 Tax=Staurois parvus TaxID=386267 RepID=A0ABN9F621_9NEOB|nr:unnamed protein product [Staurois parvus]
MLGTGLLVYLLSKEMYVINHETVYMISFGLLTVYAVKKYGPTLAEYIDQISEEKIAEIQNVKDTEIKFLENSIKEEKEEQWRVEGRHHLFEAKRNNVAVILEANYRERLLNVYNEVKKRLDYQVALQHLLRHREQEHMINWVEKNVVQSITAQQQKESIAKCISDLKLLSKKAQAAV